MWLAASLACTTASPDKAPDPEPTTDSSPGTTSPPTPPTPGDDGPFGFVGSPCERDADCDYAGGTCLRDENGFPRGTCSAACEEFCDDAEGFPTTFCAEVGALPVAAAELGAGACLSRCNFGIHPGTGCRDGYGCAEVARANDDDRTLVCLPDTASDLPGCIADLAARGVPFEPTVLADEQPAEDPTLTCHVEEPVRMFSGYQGIDLTYSNGTGPESVVGTCTLAHALADTLEDLAGEGVVRVRHLGTYNCRTIAGSSSLSRHGYGDAIDLSGFEFDDGTSWTLVDDWEHDVTAFDTEAGEWLFETAQSWHEDQLWNIILTPNYNDAHDDHFHVDLTPGSDLLRSGGRYVFGPSPWPGE